MNPVVVDVNVALVADGRNDQASDRCMNACIQAIERIVTGGATLVLDDEGQIEAEYLQLAAFHDQSGIAQQFYVFVITYRATPSVCVSVSTSALSEGAIFSKGNSLAAFDRSDRKYVLTSLGHPESPPIQAALDTDWLDAQDALVGIGVTVEMLCRPDLNRIRQRRNRR